MSVPLEASAVGITQEDGVLVLVPVPFFPVQSHSFRGPLRCDCSIQRAAVSPSYHGTIVQTQDVLVTRCFKLSSEYN